jgi:DNA polymerase-3 subunit alpha
LVKSFSSEANRFKRINVQKIASFKDLLNKPISEVTFNLKSLKELDDISKFLPKNGETLITIKLSDKINNYKFQLKNRRNIDRKTINLLRNKEISALIT